MTDYQMTEFRGVMVELQRTFRYKANEWEFGEMVRHYFDALRAYEVVEIRAAAVTYVRRGRTFPRLADLFKLLPHRSLKPATMPEMTDEESVAYQLAKEHGWEGSPCRCKECVAAGVSHLPLRYVPDVNPDGSDPEKS